MKRQEKMAEAKPNTDFLTDVGFDLEMARKLMKYGVTQLEDLADIDTEDEDFKKLNLNGLQTKKFLKQRERAKQPLPVEVMDPDFNELLKSKGLTNATIAQLLKCGVLKKNNLQHLTDTKIDSLALEPASAQVQKQVLKKLVEDSTRPSVAEDGGILVSGVKAKFGNITGGSDVSIAKAENVHKESKGVRVEDFNLETGNIESSNFCAASISHLPPKPKDLVLETTDCLLEAMSDGPLSPSFKVKHCSEAFHDKNKKEAYSMEKTPRGGVLVINVNKVEGQEPRTGTDVDRDKLKTLFEQLHFAVTVFNDENGLSAEQIRDKVKAFADKANREKGEAYVVCLLSHGIDDCLYGTDGKLLPFDTVFGLFDDRNCPGLVDRPKIFLIQACRTVKQGLQSPPEEKEKGGRNHTAVCYATQAGYYAFRNTTNGSWFIEAVTKIFADYANEEDIIYMMYRVHYAVQMKLKLKPAENISPEVRLTLSKKLLFFPGIQK